MHSEDLTAELRAIQARMQQQVDESHAPGGSFADAHIQGDKLLLETLELLGRFYGIMDDVDAIVAAWRNIYRRYA